MCIIIPAKVLFFHLFCTLSGPPQWAQYSFFVAGGPGGVPQFICHEKARAREKRETGKGFHFPAFSKPRGARGPQVWEEEQGTTGGPGAPGVGGGAGGVPSENFLIFFLPK